MSNKVAEVFQKYRREMQTGRSMGLGDLNGLEADVCSALGDANPIRAALSPVQKAIAETQAARTARAEAVASPPKAAPVKAPPAAPRMSEVETKAIPPMATEEEPPEPTEPEAVESGLTAGELRSLYSFAELSDMAREKDVEGRSSMNKGELAEALAAVLGEE